MSSKGIIAPIKEPTDWVSAMVLVQKPSDDLWVCIDPGDLNKAIKRPHYPLRTIEECTAEMPGAKFFTVLDARDAFYSIKLDEQSAKRTTFGTPFGRYMYLRIPEGISSASEVYQQTIENLLHGYPGFPIMDDILVSGRTLEEHDRNVRAVLSQLQEIGVKLSPGKCKFRLTSVKYIGHEITDEGLRPDPAKVRAIQDMPQPQDVTELLRFLGMVKYLAKFIPNLSDLAAPLNELLRKDREWIWEIQQATAFRQIQATISETTTLAFFDVNEPVVLTCDSSKDGIGAACLQEGKPIAFASRAMTSAETRYALLSSRSWWGKES